MRLELNEIAATIIKSVPDAYAYIYGSDTHPEITGTILFYSLWFGTLIAVDLNGLPTSDSADRGDVFKLLIHEGTRCLGYPENPFSEAGGYYNPKNGEASNRFSDLPSVIGSKGRAVQIFYTDRFTPQEITGKTIVIHSQPDSFLPKSPESPSVKIACGEILRNRV